MPRRLRPLALVLSVSAGLAGAGVFGGTAPALAHGGSYQPPADPPPLERPPRPGPTTGGGGTGNGPTTPGGDVGGGTRTPTTPGGGGGGPTTPGGGGGTGPTTPGGGAGWGPSTPGGGPGGGTGGAPPTGGPGKNPGGAGPTTPGGGGFYVPRRRKLPPSGDALPDPNHWSRWWYSQRAVLLGLETHVGRTGASTPSATDRATSADMWRLDVQRSLARALQDDDEDVASAAAIALGKHGDAADGPALLAVLRDGKRNQSVREAAALGLGLIGTSDHPSSRDGTRVLMDVAAKDREPERLRAISAWALGLRGDAASVPFLLDVAASESDGDDLPSAATSSLGLSRCDLVLEPLVAWLESTPGRRRKETVRRVHAAHGLAHLGDSAAIPALRAACRDDSEDVRRAAALALGALAKPDDEETSLALCRLLDRDRDDGVRNTAAIALGRIGSKAGEKSLRYAYEKSDSSGQCFAALGLGLYARTTDDPGLLGELRSDLKTRANADLRGALAIALGIARDRGAAKTLRTLLDEKGDSELRAYVAMALGMIGDTTAADSLRELLEDTRDPLLRRETASALGLLGDFKAVEVLRKLVEDGSSLFVQGSAAVALGRIGGGDAAKTLVAILDDRKRPGIARGMAAVGLGCLLDRNAGRGLGRVGAHLNWYFRTDSVDEILTIL